MSFAKKNKSFNLSPLTKMIREEAGKLVKEQVGKNSFNKWALDLLKSEYGSQIPASINVGNVIDFLQGSKFKLKPEEFEARKTIPASYASLLNQFKNRDNGRSIPSDSEVVPDDEEQEDKLSYRQGDVPLDVIGQEMGMTKMGAAKKIDAAAAKLQRLAGGGDEDDGVATMLANVDKARQSAAADYLVLLNASKGNVNSFLKAIQAAKLVNIEDDIGMVSNIEKSAIKELYNSLKTHGRDVAMEMLISDAESDPSDRIWKTFQAAVARKASPRRKKGEV